MVESSRLSLGDIHNPGPGFVPFFLGLSMVVLSVLSLLAPDIRVKAAAFWDSRQIGKKIFYIFIGLMSYLVFLKILGFYIDTLLLMIYLMKLSGEKGYKRSIPISVLSIVIIYILFYKFLFIPFPQGILGF